MAREPAQNPSDATELVAVTRDLATRLAAARSWARAGVRIAVPGVALGAAACRAVFLQFLDDPARKAERYGASFAIVFARDAQVRRIELRLRVKPQGMRGSPPYVAAYVVAGEGESLVAFQAFKSAADYDRLPALDAVGWYAHWLNAVLATDKAEKRIADPESATVAVSEVALEHACTAFMNALPGPVSFANDDYVQRERAAKEALALHFREEILPALRVECAAEVPRDAAADARLAALGRALLPPVDVGAVVRPWLQPRDHHFTQRFDDAQWAAFARAVAGLLDEGVALDARLESFNRELAACGARAEQKSLPAQRRSLASYFLALAAPAHHLHLDATLLNRFLLRLEARRVPPEDLSATAYRAILDLAETVEGYLALRGFEPRDLLDVHGFMRYVTGHVGGGEDDAAPAESSRVEPEVQRPSTATAAPQNVLIEGVAGAGKLARAIELAVEICDGVRSVDVARLRERFAALVREERIFLVAMHPGLTYADFIEGAPTDAATAGANVRDGVLKRLAARARIGVADAPAHTVRPLRERQIFKVSLDRDVEDHCIRHGIVAIGGAEGLDLAGVPREPDWEAGRERLVAALARQSGGQHGRPGLVFALWNFKDRLEEGDVVLVPRGPRRISAIGVVEGPYRHEPNASIAPQHVRSARWLARDLDVPVEQLYGKPFDQQTVYSLERAHVDFDALERLLGAFDAVPRTSWVLIVDGIERGDAAAAFGEAALLLDPRHREGGRAPLDVALPLSGERFALPDNLHVIATRDVCGPPLAAHLRQRFRCETVDPDPAMLEGAGGGTIESGGLDLRRWLSTLNARLAWLAGSQNVLGHGVLAQVDSLAALVAIYRSVVLPHVVGVLGNDRDRLLATLGPGLVRADASAHGSPLHPAATSSGSASTWRLAATPTLLDFVRLYEPESARAAAAQ